MRSASGAVTNEACCTKTRARLALPRIGYKPCITERLRGPPCVSVKNRAGIFRAIGAAAVDLQRPPVVEISPDRPADNGDADEFLAVVAGDGILVPNRRLVVSVMLTDKRPSR